MALLPHASPGPVPGPGLAVSLRGWRDLPDGVLGGVRRLDDHVGAEPGAALGVLEVDVRVDLAGEAEDQPLGGGLAVGRPGRVDRLDDDRGLLGARRVLNTNDSGHAAWPPVASRE